MAAYESWSKDTEGTEQTEDKKNQRDMADYEIYSTCMHVGQAYDITWM